jgi:hypothetical protein
MSSSRVHTTLTGAPSTAFDNSTASMAKSHFDATAHSRRDCAYSSQERSALHKAAVVSSDFGADAMANKPQARSITIIARVPYLSSILWNSMSMPHRLLCQGAG